MQASRPLIEEHRLIKCMMARIQNKLAQVEQIQKINPFYFDIVIDFIRTYANSTHLDKEEDILFRELNKKVLSDVDRKDINNYS